MSKIFPNAITNNVHIIHSVPAPSAFSAGGASLPLGGAEFASGVPSVADKKIPTFQKL